jgi:RNA-directed DNA polymerase
MREHNKRSATDGGKSERPSSTDEAREPPRGTSSREGERRATEPREGKTAGIEGQEPVSTRLARVAELARQHPDRVLTSLSHHIDAALLREAYERTRKDGAVGVDGQTAAEYAEALDENLASLLERFKSGAYKAPPVKRVHIPKGDGSKTRPIGIPTFEDKVLQRAVLMVLQAIYEVDFRSCSYGFRPGRNQHQALAATWTTTMNMDGGYVLELDIEGFFDSLDHGHLRSFLDKRVRDGVIRRTIDKWLKAGVLENGELRRCKGGSPQGGVISPLLANVYLHHVLDTWLEDEIRPRLQGEVFLVRYADDAVLVFSNEMDARRVMDVLPKRFGKFGLTLHPTKTRLVPFRRPRRDDDDPGTFDLLGFTHYWGKTLKGDWAVKRRTMRSRVRRTLKSIGAWCRAARHLPIRWQHETLSKKLRGHYAYYGVTGNWSSLAVVAHWTRTLWMKWLCRRSERKTLTWERFTLMLERYPLPPPRVVHSALQLAARPST